MKFTTAALLLIYSVAFIPLCRTGSMYVVLREVLSVFSLGTRNISSCSLLPPLPSPLPLLLFMLLMLSCCLDYLVESCCTRKLSNTPPVWIQSSINSTVRTFLYLYRAQNYTKMDTAALPSLLLHTPTHHREMLRKSTPTSRCTLAVLRREDSWHAFTMQALTSWS